MRELASDNFDRADAAGLGALWPAPTGCQSLNIKGNRAVNSTVATLPGGNHYIGSIWTGTTPSADMYSQATVRVLTNLSWVGVSARQLATDRTAYYFGANPLDFAGGNARVLWKEVSSARTLLNTEAINIAVDDVLRIEVEGSTIRGFVNGVLRLTATDFAIAFGFPGVVARKNSAAIDTPSFDDWSAGDFGGGSKMIGNKFRMAGLGGMV